MEAPDRCCCDPIDDENLDRNSPGNIKFWKEWREKYPKHMHVHVNPTEVTKEKYEKTLSQYDKLTIYGR